MIHEKYAKVNNICLVAISAILFTYALIFTKTVLIPFVISIFCYFMASPMVHWLQTKYKIPRIISITLTFLLFFIFICLLLFIITNSISNFIKGADIYKERISQFVLWGADYLQKLGIKIDSNQIQEVLKNLPVFTMIKTITGNIISIFSNITLIIVFVLFFLVGENAQRKKSNNFINEIKYQISRYLTTKFFISILTGSLVGAILLFFDVELAFMFATVTLLLNFIPSIGSIIATLLPLPVIFLQFGPNWKFFTLLITCSAIQIIIGNFIEPKILGENMDLHPVTILVFLIFWGIVWGIPGAFLGVPITAIIKIIFNKIEATKPIAELMAGRIPY